MKRWTSQQQAAIENRRGTLLVSAAAGSGKTAVLVERALRLIAEDGVDADRLLIVTFTNAAAAELRARLAAGLDERIAAAPPAQRTVLRRQRMLLQRASICTADAFCLELVRQNFFRLDLPPDIGVGDESQLAGLRAAALEATLEEYAKNEDFARFSGMYGRSRDDRTAGDTLLELYRFLAAQPSRASLRRKMAAAWADEGPAEHTLWGKPLLAAARSHAGRAVRLAQRLAAQPCPPGRWTGESWADYTAALLQRTQDAAAALETGWDGARAALAAFEVPRAKAKLPDGSAADRLRAALKAEMAQAAECLPCTAAEDLADRRAAAPVIAAVMEAEEAFETRFFAAKKDRRQLEFSDVEQLALSLLWDEEKEERTAFSRETAARFHTVMVDEYQDTNALQGRLYDCLADETGGNLFLVGDIKQSIYRFRHAEPALFQRLRAQFAPFDGKTFPAALALNANFRSLPGVLDGVNYFFSVLMSPDLGEVEYNADEWLNCGLAQAGADLPLSPPVYLDLVQREPQAEDDAAQVAWRVQQLVESGTPVRDGDTLRPTGYGDICLLLRTRSHFEDYVRAFAARGIPCYADVGADLLSAPEVQPLASLLRALDNPGDDVQLAAVLTGPLAGFEMDLLVQLRVVQRTGSLYGALLAWQRAREGKSPLADVVPPDTAARLDDFLALFARLRAQAAGMEAGRLCELVLEHTGWAAAIGGGPQGPVRRARLEEFCAWAASAGKHGLPALVRAMADTREGGGLPQQTAERAPGCVSIMTIHRSKGLEFPIVLLADTARRFNAQDIRTAPFQFHPRWGAAMQLPGPGGRYDTTAMAWLRQAKYQELLGEEMRVLYVALTRAKDLLCITALVPEQEKLPAFLSNLAAGLEDGPDPAFLGTQSSLAGWLLAAALLHPEMQPLRELAGAPGLPLLDSCGSHFRLTVRGAGQDLPQEGAEQAAEAAAPDEELWRELERGFAWQDPFAALSQVPAKVSVSSLSHKGESFGWQPGRPGFARRKTGLTGAQRGTAAHRFLQLARLELFREDAPAAFAAEKKRMVETGLLDAQSAAALDEKRILAFFASGLYRRMLAAMQPPARLWREFDFITSLPAAEVMADGKDYGDAEVLVQGVADAVLVFADHAELVDYKTDRVPDAGALVSRYAAQLDHYRRALEKRLEVPVSRCTIYSLHLGREIPLPAAKTAKNTP